MHDNQPGERAVEQRPNVILIGPKDARRRVRPKLTVTRLIEEAMWRDLPAGPAVPIGSVSLPITLLLVMATFGVVWTLWSTGSEFFTTTFCPTCAAAM